MRRDWTHSRRLARVVPALTSVIVACGAIGAAAAVAATTTPPSLKINVPTKVRPHQRYKIVILVTYDKKSLRTTPYLVSFLQFTGSSCKATAGAEHALGGAVFGDYIGSVPNSPFVRTDTWRAGTLTGARRVCAYLYRRRVSQKSTSKPLLAASRLFHNL